MQLFSLDDGSLLFVDGQPTSTIRSYKEGGITQHGFQSPTIKLVLNTHQITTQNK